MQDNPKNTVQSVAKAFAVLKAFDATLPELTLTEIGERAGLDRGTSFRLANTLCQLGYLAKVSRTRRYRLTLKCLELGFSALAQSDLKMLARPLLRQMVPNVADAASLGMLDNTEIVYIERAQGDLPNLNLDRRTGSRTSAYSAALGHAILAWKPVPLQREILERSHRIKVSEKTLTEIEPLMERLAQVRARGFAISDGENAYGLRTVAAPIFDDAHEVVAGISLTIHADRMPLDAFLTRAVPECLRIAKELSGALEFAFGAIATSRKHI